MCVLVLHTGEGQVGVVGWLALCELFVIPEGESERGGR